MTVIEAAILIAIAALIVSSAWYIRRSKPGRRTPDILRPGRPLPDFQAADEQGNPVRSTELVGTAAVILFVRGNWCPFCSAQVKDLTSYYKNIVELGGRLIFVTPKPLETTRRVAEFFDVEFDFWLDESLSVARQLGLLHAAGVPEDYRTEFGNDTVWPAALVIDRAGIIRFTELSAQISDRPNPQLLLGELRRAISS